MSVQEVVSVELPEPVPVGGQSFRAATILLIADPDDPDCDTWLGKVRSMEQRHDRLDVFFLNGEVATVLVSKAYVSMIKEADPDEAFAYWYEDVFAPLMRGAE